CPCASCRRAARPPRPVPRASASRPGARWSWRSSQVPALPAHRVRLIQPLADDLTRCGGHVGLLVGLALVRVLNGDLEESAREGADLEADCAVGAALGYADLGKTRVLRSVPQCEGQVPDLILDVHWILLVRS